MKRRQIVIVGGGTSGAVVAQSLASSTDHEIVVVEPGLMSPHDDTPQFFDVLKDFSVQTLHEVSLTQDGSLTPYVQARVLGGGSAINGMLLTGDVPDYVHGLVRRASLTEIGTVGHALLASGGRPSTMWWNNGRWNPGRALHHLVEEGRVRLIHDDVENLILQNNQVCGVETRMADMDADIVVMCSGALVTPQILLRSGVGHHNDHVGWGLQDHPAITFALARREAEQGFFDTSVVRDGVTTSGEKFLIVGYERASHVEPDISLVSVLLMTPKSRGWVALSESEPDVCLNMLSHPDDVTAMREAVRELVATVVAPTFREAFDEIYVDDEGVVVDDLVSFNDADLDVWIRNHLRPVSHVSSSCSRAVHTSGAVAGLSGLFVADASVLEQIPSCTPAGPVTMEARRIANEIEGAMT